jgi:esterase/lipase superfamily enzyme
VFFGTNRRPLNAVGGEGRFANVPGPAVTYGSAVVSVPRSHRPGHVERPGSFIGWFTGPDPKKHVMIRVLTPLSRQVLLRSIAEQAAKPGPGRKTALIFVHGFNVPFDDAAFRTAQMSYDIGFRGAPVFNSWPSEASPAPLSYTHDGTRIEASRPYLKSFIADVVTGSGADRVIIIGHSMGTRGVTRVLEELSRERPQVTARISALILAAPDIAASIFNNDIAPKLRRMARSTTLYASSTDRALQVSHQVAGDYALGDARGGVRIYRDMVSIDATKAGTDFLGHSAYGNSPHVLRDIASIVAGRPPAQRPWLRRMPQGYYVLQTTR